MVSIFFTFLVLAKLVGAVIGLLCLHAFIWNRVWCLRGLWQMRRGGRCLPRGQFEQHLAAGKGTVVFEAPTLGWNFLRVWWTADDVQALGRAAALSEESSDSDGLTPSPFECWCRDTYISSPGGRASLVPAGIFGCASHRFPESIKERFPCLPTVFVRSAVVDLFRECPDEERSS